MNTFILITQSYFDGLALHNDGPYTVLVEEGRIIQITRGQLAGESALVPDPFREPNIETRHTTFAMPGLVEGHCHTFLDGDELAFGARKAHLKLPFNDFMQVAHRSVQQSLDSGITLLRDAGDIHGVNHELRSQLQKDPHAMAQVLSPGIAIRKEKGYGSFMAREAGSKDALIALIKEIAPQADQLKILLTDIIDFENGQMRREPQFDLKTTRVIVQEAKKYGLLTYAHCSGLDGLEIAVQAGIDSIEHGFFINEEILKVMADKQIAWVPTFSPVDFQWRHPKYAGWNEHTCKQLRAILDNHDKHMTMAYDMGVPVVMGSDAGSYGSAHGLALIDEILFTCQTGVSLEKVLVSATHLPRTLWSLASADIQVGNQANFVLFDQSPFDDIQALKSPNAVFHYQWYTPSARLLSV